LDSKIKQKQVELSNFLKKISGSDSIDNDNNNSNINDVETFDINQRLLELETAQYDNNDYNKEQKRLKSNTNQQQSQLDSMSSNKKYYFIKYEFLKS